MALTTVSPGLLDTTAQYYGFKNRIINGAMGIWQRGTTGTSGYTSVDRWFGLNTTSFNRSTDVPTGFQYSLEFGNASATYIITDQRIESVNCYDLVGHRVTVSFWAKNVSGASWIGAELYYANALDNFSATTIFDSKTWLSPSSSWTQYTFTSNVVVPANGANGLVLRIYRNTDTASTTRITGVQLEKGSTATSFDYRPYGTELALCQRYYWRFTGNGADQIPVTFSSNIVYWSFLFPTEMRASPTPSTNATNANYANPPSSNQWAFGVPGVNYLGKTGTVTVANFSASTKAMGWVASGASYTGTGIPIDMALFGLYFDASAEL